MRSSVIDKDVEAVLRALVSRHPRDFFQLATKMPLRDFKSSDDLEKIFNEHLREVRNVQSLWLRLT